MSLPDHTLPLFLPSIHLVFIHSLFQPEIAEELVQVSVFHVLSDHTQRVCVHADGQQTDNVGVPQARHDSDLLEEVIPSEQQGQKLL